MIERIGYVFASVNFPAGRNPINSAEGFLELVNFPPTDRVIIFSVITNIYNKKTKVRTLMELFTATGKPKSIFLTTRDVRCVQHG
jgi:hypothetical protein